MQLLPLAAGEHAFEDAVVYPVAEGLEKFYYFGAPFVVGDVVDHDGEVFAGTGGVVFYHLAR